MTIIIHAYNPLWPQEFETIRQSLQEILGELALRIDHIGSTSVPGLGAKDVIDIQITVAGADAGSQAKTDRGRLRVSGSHHARSRAAGRG